MVPEEYYEIETKTVVVDWIICVVNDWNTVNCPNIVLTLMYYPWTVCSIANTAELLSVSDLGLKFKNPYDTLLNLKNTSFRAALS